MSHFASPYFWFLFRQLPPDIQAVAEANFKLLAENPRHPSLHFKKVGKYWSVRIGCRIAPSQRRSKAGSYGVRIGTHADYDAKIYT